jgi:probable biosynthetic protein (TIGR04098 family)
MDVAGETGGYPYKAGCGVKRTFSIGMPQMAIGHLSENWLLKELGSLHWDRLCEALGSNSQSLVDSEGRRLYATFVRIKLDLDENLSAFCEGDGLSLSISMKRFGRSTVLSEIRIEGAGSGGRAQLMSTFSFRSHDDNKALAKSQPANEYHSSIESLSETPTFFSEYSEIRRAHGRRKLDEIADTYQINPFTDSNGANLLYFASYQSIHDFLASRGSTDLFTKTRDICFFRNCDLADRITLRDGVLFRMADGESLAHVTTTKAEAKT